VNWDAIAGRIVRTTTRLFSGSTAITYTPTGGAPVVLSGRSIFTAAHAEDTVDNGEVSVQTVAPTLDLWLADLAAPPAENDSVTVGGVSYRVANCELDGEGGAFVILEEVP